MKVRGILTVVLLSLVLVGAGVLVASRIDLMPAQASTRAALVDQLFRGLLGVATVVFLLVEGLLLYAVLRFRRRAGDEADAAPIHGNSRLEIVWTLIPAVLVAAIAFYSFRVLSQSERGQEVPLVVEITARQFVWEFHYPAFGVTSTEVHLPLSQPVAFRITSEDVIHSFWVPEFRVKQDATPGQVAELLITPTRAGRYPVRCAELCGAGHAGMTTWALVEAQAAFDAWLASQQSDPAAVADPAGAGREIFSRYGCQACHTLTDAAATGIVGPPLDGLGGRAGSRVPGTEARLYVEQSILDPDSHIVEGYPSGVMPPNLGERLSSQDLRLLVEYLLQR